ncbi:MAG: polysaccharide pyruvyl transferase family protein [Deltaproteobacteria bacterium]|nr:polysaccharide pyruvyl transferase family protein [Deltaproteobacteria bacterium]
MAVYSVLRDCYALDKRIIPITLGRELLGHFLQRQLRRYSSIMIGGGTQFTSMNAEYLKILIRCNDRVWSFGTGVGSCGFCEPPDSDLSEIVCFLNRINPLTVRGPLSQETLFKYDINSKVIGDPALGYAKECDFFQGGKKILVNLLSPLDTEENIIYQKFIANLASPLSVLRANGWVIDFLALGPGDYSYIDNFRSTFGFLESEISEIYTSVDRFFESLRGVSLIISMRLHGAILASCAGVPFLLCNYRSKCLDFAASIQQEDLLLSPNSSASDIINSIEYLLSNSNKISKAIKSKALYFRNIQSEFLKNQLCS